MVYIKLKNVQFPYYIHLLNHIHSIRVFPKNDIIQIYCKDSTISESFQH